MIISACEELTKRKQSTSSQYKRKSNFYSKTQEPSRRSRKTDSKKEGITIRKAKQFRVTEITSKHYGLTAARVTSLWVCLELILATSGLDGMNNHEERHASLDCSGAMGPPPPWSRQIRADRQHGLNI